MYKVYVVKQRRSGSEVLGATRTQTPSFEAATAAFWSLYDSGYDNRHLLLMTCDGHQLNAYRYESQPGDRDYVEKGQDLRDE